MLFEGGSRRAAFGEVVLVILTGEVELAATEGEDGHVGVWFDEGGILGDGFFKVEFGFVVLVGFSGNIAEDDVGAGVFEVEGEGVAEFGGGFIVESLAVEGIAIYEVGEGDFAVASDEDGLFKLFGGGDGVVESELHNAEVDHRFPSSGVFVDDELEVSASGLEIAFGEEATGDLVEVASEVAEAGDAVVEFFGGGT